MNAIVRQLPVYHPQTVALLNKINLKMAFGLSLSEINKMTSVERNYWVLVARNIERRKTMTAAVEKAKRSMG